MSQYRKWFCICSGRKIELDYESGIEEEGGEPFCKRCGASPSSDPKKTIRYEDVENWDD